jgi:hypothetical protein
VLGVFTLLLCIEDVAGGWGNVCISTFMIWDRIPLSFKRKIAFLPLKFDEFAEMPIFAQSFSDDEAKLFSPSFDVDFYECKCSDPF